MRNILKRLTAVLLLIGLSVSFIVPATFAENGEGAAAESITYDFKLYYNEGLKADSNTTVPYNSATGKYTNFSGGSKYNGSSRIYSWFYQSYGTKVNWGIEAVDGSITGALANRVKNFEFRGDADLGMRVNLTKAAGKWAALRIQVPTAGTYEVRVTGSNASTPLSNLDLYIFPAVTAYTQSTVMHDPYTTEAVAPENQISTYLTNEYKVGAVATTAQDLACTVGEKTFSTAGDYIVVFQTTGAGIADDYIYLSSLTLTPSAGGPAETTTQTTAAATTQAPTETTAETTTEATTAPSETTVPEVEDTFVDGVYDIEVYNRERYKAMFGTAATLVYAKAALGGKEGVYNAGEEVNTILSREYPSGLNWRLEAFDSSMALTNFTFYASANTGLRIQKLNADEAASGWAAFRILVSQGGKYDLSVTTESSWGAHNIYVFPANEQAMTEADIEAKLTADTLIAAAPKSGARTATYKDLDFAAAGEYIVVFQMEETDAKTTMYLSQMALTPVAEAPVIEPAYQEGVFNFALYEEETYAPMFIGKDGKFANLLYAKPCPHCGMTIQACLADRYASGQLNWMPEATTFGQQSFMAAGYENGTAMGLRLRFAPGTTTDATDMWAAMRVKVNKAGTYVVTVFTDYAYAYNAQMYIFPAAEKTMSNDALIAAMTEENSAGKMYFKAKTPSYEVGQWTFPEAGEYIIVLKNIEGSKRIVLDQITLTEPVVEQPKVPVDEMLYDFDLVAKDAEFLKKIFPKKMANGELAYERIEKMYAEDKLQWKYETYSDTFPIISATFRENFLRVKSVENFRDIQNAWIAFRLESPGAGTYDVRLVSDGASKAVANIYLIPAQKNAMRPEQIQAGMTKENLLVQKAIFDDDGTFYLGEFTFDTTKEYLMVVEFTKGTTLCLSQILMTKDGLKADGTVKKEKIYNGTVYNLNLTDPMDGIYPVSSVYVADKLDDMNKLYASGALNWNYLAVSDDLAGGKGKPSDYVRFTRGYGLRVYSVKDSWIALKIKSPGSGDFTVSIDYVEGGRNGTMAMYVLPGDTDPDKLWETTDPSNRVGKVCLTNETGEVGYEAGKSAYVGYCRFEAGKEYILLLECYDNSEFIEINGYIHINKVIMERGIIDYQAKEDRKKVDYINVAENINQIADARSTAVVAEVNGHDYYFLPLEGRLMVVYDLDTGELVDEVKTKDVHPRAAAIGPDGTIWLGGSMKHLAWYNPITQEYKTSPSFISIDGMQELTGIAGLTVAEDGMVYFTAYYGAYMVSYNPETKEFHNFGQLINRENMFIGAIQYYNGYLYVNYYSSPVDWSLVAKIDPKTGEVVATADLTDYWEESSSIMRLEMLGDDYLVAGGANLPQAILMDPDTPWSFRKMTCLLV